MLKAGPVFVRRGHNECLGFEWEVSLCIVLSFSWGEFRFLAGGIGQGVILVLAVAAPGANSLGGVEAWVLSGCQGRGGDGNEGG